MDALVLLSERGYIDKSNVFIKYDMTNKRIELPQPFYDVCTMFDNQEHDFGLYLAFCLIIFRHNYCFGFDLNDNKVHLPVILRDEMTNILTVVNKSYYEYALFKKSTHYYAENEIRAQDAENYNRFAYETIFIYLSINKNLSKNVILAIVNLANKMIGQSTFSLYNHLHLRNSCGQIGSELIIAKNYQEAADFMKQTEKIKHKFVIHIDKNTTAQEFLTVRSLFPAQFWDHINLTYFTGYDRSDINIDIFKFIATGTYIATAEELRGWLYKFEKMPHYTNVLIGKFGNLL
jgi:hypothetical protein